MPSDNERSREIQKQLSLPFNDHLPENRIEAANNVVCFTGYFEKKENSIKVKERIDKTKILVSYAESLHW